MKTGWKVDEWRPFFVFAAVFMLFSMVFLFCVSFMFSKCQGRARFSPHLVDHWALAPLVPRQSWGRYVRRHGDSKLVVRQANRGSLECCSLIPSHSFQVFASLLLYFTQLLLKFGSFLILTVSSARSPSDQLLDSKRRSEASQLRRQQEGHHGRKDFLELGHLAAWKVD